MRPPSAPGASIVSTPEVSRPCAIGWTPIGSPHSMPSKTLSTSKLTRTEPNEHCPDHKERDREGAARARLRAVRRPDGALVAGGKDRRQEPACRHRAGAPYRRPVVRA